MRKLLITLVLLVQLCFSTVVVNSLDGRDVVSAMYYAALTDDDFVFVPAEYDPALVYGKVAGPEVFLVQSAEYPVIPGMADDLETAGHTLEIYSSGDPYATNLELASRSGATGFVLSDPVYGYNTISALAYARLNSMYLIFVDSGNMGVVVDFLEGSSPQDVLLYGNIDPEVKSVLDGRGIAYSEINNGDKFDDNLELVGMYLEQNPSAAQLILSDGNGIEDTMAAADTPVVLISPIIPDATYDFLNGNAASGRVPVVLVVDQLYAQTAYDLKTSVNNDAGSEVLHVLVKLGEGSDVSGSQMRPVEFFPLPGPVVGLEIAATSYNRATGELEVIYRNSGNAQEFVKSTIAVYVDGTRAGTVGDAEAFTLEKGQSLGRKYAIAVEDGLIMANITALFGSSKKSFENGIQVMMESGRVEFVDQSALGITDFTADGEDLYVTFSNMGDVNVFFMPYVVLTVEGRTTKLDDDQLYELLTGESRMVKFPGILDGSESVLAGASYGSREAFLEKAIEEEYVPSGDDPMLLIIGVVVLAVILGAAYFLTRKK